jgi:hypothetical protein
VNNHAKDYAACIRAALTADALPPLGANEKNLLDRPDAIEIEDSAWRS